MQAAKRNYEIYKKKLLAIVKALTKIEIILIGCYRKVQSLGQS